MNWVLVGVQMSIIIGLSFAFAVWVYRLLMAEKIEKAKRYNKIQARLRDIHETLCYEETDMFERQRLFTEQLDLMEERRELLSA